MVACCCCYCCSVCLLLLACACCLLDCTLIAIDLRLRRISAGGAQGSALGSAKAAIACTCLCVSNSLSHSSRSSIPYPSIYSTPQASRPSPSQRFHSPLRSFFDHACRLLAGCLQDFVVAGCLQDFVVVCRTLWLIAGLWGCRQDLVVACCLQDFGVACRQDFGVAGRTLGLLAGICFTIDAHVRMRVAQQLSSSRSPCPCAILPSLLPWLGGWVGLPRCGPCLVQAVARAVAG